MDANFLSILTPPSLSFITYFIFLVILLLLYYCWFYGFR
jgi:hypothetical protein